MLHHPVYAVQPSISQSRRPAMSFTDKHAAYPFALEFREYGQRGR